MSFFDPKTQGYIDKTLQTLNTWFGGNTTPTNGGGTTPTNGGGTTPTNGGGTTPPSPKLRPPQQDDNNKPKTGLYIGIGVGVLAIVGVTFYLIKKKK
jgi:aryl-phospho-beta-D-glucosidase BglC (GH1 family)